MQNFKNFDNIYLCFSQKRSNFAQIIHFDMNDWKDLLAGTFAEELKTVENTPVEENTENESTAKQKSALRIEYDKKGRKGKPVTLITLFYGNEEELSRLTKLLQKKIGTGGSHCFNSEDPFDGQILLQGDCRKKADEIIKSEGYKTKVIGL